MRGTPRRHGRSTSRAVALLCILLPLMACDDSPLEEDLQDTLIAEGDTVSFEGLQATIAKFNTSWVPFEGSVSPPPGETLVTLRLEITNRSDGPRSLSDDDFTLMAMSFNFGPGDDSRVVVALPGGREPRLTDATLAPGETVRGWLTYSLPRRLDPSEVLWNPRPGEILRIEVPLFVSRGGRIESSLVFGRVTDPDGNPQPGTRLEISPVETFPGIVGVDSVIGDCVGNPVNVRQVVTSEAGWYQDTVRTALGDEFCIDVHALTDVGELRPSRASGIVRSISADNLFAEIPRVRIDLTLE